jgi:hypothetical protein
MRDLLDDYNMLPADVVFRDNFLGGTAYSRFIGLLARQYDDVPTRPTTSCVGCGAADFKRGQCTYCGRHA